MAMHIGGTTKESRKRDRRERFGDAEKIRLSLPRKQDLDAAGLDPDEAVLDDVDPADPIGPRDHVGVREELQGVGLRGLADRERVRDAAQMKATWRRGLSVTVGEKDPYNMPSDLSSSTPFSLLNMQTSTSDQVRGQRDGHGSLMQQRILRPRSWLLWPDITTQPAAGFKAAAARRNNRTCSRGGGRDEPA